MQCPNLRPSAVRQRIGTYAEHLSHVQMPQCQQGRCVAAIWWDIRAINELKDKDFSAPCPDCGHQDVFFGIEAIEMYHGELSAIERMELDEEELREFGLDEEAESED
jgi:hypothetical protein